MSPTALKNELLAKAYGPDAEPLTPEELALLHPTETQPVPASPSHNTPRIRFRTQTVVAISLCALTAGVIAGYLYGRSETHPFAAPPEPSDGIVLQDGSLRSFSDATCTPALDPKTGTLATVSCTWTDGTTATLDPHGITSPNVLGTTTREPQTNYWVR